MNTDLILSAASGADSTQAQEQSVKSFSSSSSNLNNCVDVDEVEEFDLDDYAYDYHTGNPAVYVGTYHKYNCGSIFGAWLNITAFADYEEFIAVCRYLHRDEADPEFMAQDFTDFPEEWYTEGFMSEREFDLIQVHPTFRVINLKLSAKRYLADKSREMIFRCLRADA